MPPGPTTRLPAPFSSERSVVGELPPVPIVTVPSATVSVLTTAPSTTRRANVNVPATVTPCTFSEAFVAVKAKVGLTPVVSRDSE